MPRYTINQGLLTTLVERWHGDTNTFHLVTGEMTVTPEDYYRIPMVGDFLPYEKTEEGGMEALRRVFQDDHIIGYEISW